MTSTIVVKVVLVHDDLTREQLEHAATDGVQDYLTNYAGVETAKAEVVIFRDGDMSQHAEPEPFHERSRHEEAMDRLRGRGMHGGPC